MPASSKRDDPRDARSVKVTLHVYDFLEQSLNGLLRQIGTGGFHCGVEVYGKEWSYRRTHFGTGVFWIMPKTCTAHKFRESVPMGKVSISAENFGKLVDELKREWPGRAYDILKKNCCVFSNELCQKLGVGSIPDWITNLAGVGADMRSVVRRPLRQMEGAILGESPSRQPVVQQAPVARKTPPRPEKHKYEELKAELGGVPRSTLWRVCIGLSVTLAVASAVCVLLVVTGRIGVRHFGTLLRGSKAPSGGLRPHAPSTSTAGFPTGPAAGVAVGNPVPVPVPAPGLPVPVPVPSPTSSIPALVPSPSVPAGVVSTTLIDPKRPLFNCDDGYDTYKIDWSAEKLGWCCMQDPNHCPVSSVADTDCHSDFVDCRNAWSKDRQHWCLLHKSIRCATGASAPQVSGKDGSDGFVTFENPEDSGSDEPGSDEPFETPSYDAGGSAGLAAGPRDGAPSGASGNASSGYVGPVGSEAAFGDASDRTGETTPAAGWDPVREGNDDFAGFSNNLTAKTTLVYVLVPEPQQQRLASTLTTTDVHAGSKEELSDAAAEASTAGRATGAPTDLDDVDPAGDDFRPTKELDTITASEA